MNFNFPLAGEHPGGGPHRDLACGIAAKLEEMGRLYPRGVNDAPFLTNHDMVRLATQLGTNAGRAAHRRRRSCSPCRERRSCTTARRWGSRTAAPAARTSSSARRCRGTRRRAAGSRPAPRGSRSPRAATPPTSRCRPATPLAALPLPLPDPRAQRLARRCGPGRSRSSRQPSGSSPLLAFLRVSPGERVLVVHNSSDAASPPPRLRSVFDASGFDTLFADSWGLSTRRAAAAPGTSACPRAPLASGGSAEISRSAHQRISKSADQEIRSSAPPPAQAQRQAGQLLC